jgi:hypothetical protein
MRYAHYEQFGSYLREGSVPLASGSPTRPNPEGSQPGFLVFDLCFIELDVRPAHHLAFDPALDRF